MADSGIFIVFDGIDGGGKSTQVQRFAALLRDAGETVVVSKEPTDGTWGTKLRQSATTGRLPLEKELELFIRDRREHVDSLIQPALERGEIVILDRYFYSTVAYQGIRGADVDELLVRMRSMFPIPDVAFFLDLPTSVAMHRIANERGDQPNEFEREDALAKIRNLFQKMANECDEARLIDCSGDSLSVSKSIAAVLLGDALVVRCRDPFSCSGQDCRFRETGECDWAAIDRGFRAAWA